MSYMVRNYKLTFIKLGEVVGRLVIASADSLQAEQIGRKMCSPDTQIKVERA